MKSYEEVKNLIDVSNEGYRGWNCTHWNGWTIGKEVDADNGNGFEPCLTLQKWLEGKSALLYFPEQFSAEPMHCFIQEDGAWLGLSGLQKWKLEELAPELFFGE